LLTPYVVDAGVRISMSEEIDTGAEVVIETKIRYAGLHGYHHKSLGSDLIKAGESKVKTVSWPSLVADENPFEDLFETYRLMFPDKTVTPVIFGSPNRTVDLAATNDYVSQTARTHGLPGLLVSTPAWSAQQLEHRVLQGGFLGLKPYLSFAPVEIPAGKITIFDYLPHAHLEVADAHGWVIMLHIPRAARLRDPVNLVQLLEIERAYPDVGLIVAHIGRAYCREDVGKAFEVLGQTSQMRFDFSANTNSWVMEQLIRTVGPQRILFGSDLPILRMRMRRICEGGTYINLVPPGLYGDVSGDAHMREVSHDEGQHLSFFLYEEIMAFRKAAEATGLTTAQVADIFCNNAASLFGIA
jgi:hypothetical protein